jgi:hypothetical protein
MGAVIIDRFNLRLTSESPISQELSRDKKAYSMRHNTFSKSHLTSSRKIINFPLQTTSFPRFKRAGLLDTLMIMDFSYTRTVNA